LFMHDAFENGAGFGGAIQTDEALAQVRPGINIFRLALERGAITFLRFFQFASLEIDIAELGMVRGIVNVIDLRLKFFDAPAALCPGKFKSADAGRRSAINGEKIPKSSQPGPNDDK